MMTADTISQEKAEGEEIKKIRSLSLKREKNMKKPGNWYRLDQKLIATIHYFICGHRAFHFLSQSEKFSVGRVGLRYPKTSIQST